MEGYITSPRLSPDVPAGRTNIAVLTRDLPPQLWCLDDNGRLWLADGPDCRNLIAYVDEFPLYFFPESE